MIGMPSVYPADVGAVATKFFIGDADGTVWRFDISSQDPNQWFGEARSNDGIAWSQPRRRAGDRGLGPKSTRHPGADLADLRIR